MVEQAEPHRHDQEVDPLDEIAEAYAAIRTAKQRYRDLLRDRIRSKVVRQSDVAKRLGVTRETIRRDAMTDQERDQIRRDDADRHRHARQGGS